MPNRYRMLIDSRNSPTGAFVDFLIGLWGIGVLAKAALVSIKFIGQNENQNLKVYPEQNGQLF